MEHKEQTEPQPKKWYVITTYSGYENKVKLALQERIRHGCVVSP